ncbi:TonB-dependent receptor [Planktosalinus lacus]|uniref:TonB-dependent receptor n=1 Tax=Planktosalinus lacus TaxID=1526573 RepID=A0A8J2VCC4_9FLAO|nr:TonB-dependent receptor [Planktosalinus lacus]GGE00201.1 TonB-dependent receptor [Planktosalinus lacus]
MKLVVLFILLLTVTRFSAQTTISGVVYDGKRTPISGANVFLQGTYDGTISEADGHFLFTTDSKGFQTLQISYVSYETKHLTVDVQQMQNLSIQLREDVATLGAVTLSAGTFEAGDKARTSVLKPLDIVTTAGAAGDIVAALQTLPGTQTVGESGRLFVRGGEAGETQTFIDGIRVAQPYGASAQNIPTRGRFSPFLFSGMSFSTGGYSAEYGEALSGVLLMDTKNEVEQNQTEISLMSVGVGLGHSFKGKNSSLSINTAYINLEPYQLAVPQRLDWNRAFQSLSGETVYRKHFDKGLFKAYAAYDSSSFDFNRETINQETTERIELNNQNLYVNTSYKSYWNNNWQYFSGMSYGFSSNSISPDFINIKNKEHALHLKSKLSRRFSNRFKIFAGGELFYTQFDEQFQEQGFKLNSGYTSTIVGLFSEASIFFSKRFATQIGIRFQHDALLNESSVSPRLSLAYKSGEHAQFSLAYGQFSQAPNQEYLKYNTSLSLENTAHYILNYQYAHNHRTLRLEGYYKQYQDLVRFESEQELFNSGFTNEGSGYAGGLDVFWRDGKSFKNTEYWVSYSFIDTKRLYRDFPNKATPSFVAQHTASVVLKHWVQEWRSQLGFSHTFHSGRPFNNPNETIFMNGETNSYHSTGFNWAYLLSEQKILYFSVSNIMGTKNIFGYEYANTPGEDGFYNRKAITPTADRFFFIGFFWTISEDKKSNQLDKL